MLRRQGFSQDVQHFIAAGPYEPSVQSCLGCSHRQQVEDGKQCISDKHVWRSGMHKWNGNQPWTCPAPDASDWQHTGASFRFCKRQVKKVGHYAKYISNFSVYWWHTILCPMVRYLIFWSPMATSLPYLRKYWTNSLKITISFWFTIRFRLR